MDLATGIDDMLANDQVSVSSNGSCITITAKNYMSWWQVFVKYYHDTYCDVKDATCVRCSLEGRKR